MQDYNKSEKDKYYYKNQRDSHSPDYKQDNFSKNDRNTYYRDNDYKPRPIEISKEHQFERRQDKHYERSSRERFEPNKVKRYSRERLREFNPREKESYYNKDQRDNSKTHYIQQRDKVHQSHQPHYYQNPTTSSYQDNSLKKRDHRERSSSPKKQQKNNFPVICAINRTYFKYFEDNLSSIKKSMYDQVYNITDFRIKSFKNSEDCFLFIDSPNFTALKKCFRIFCDRTYDYLNGIYGKMSYLKTFILVPNRKFIIYYII